MNIQSLDAIGAALSTKNAERGAIPKIGSDRSSVAPSWVSLGDVQKAVQPAVRSRTQGLTKPDSSNARGPGEPSRLSVDQIVELLAQTPYLGTKTKILTMYISTRAADLSADDALRLAKGIKLAGDWIYLEKYQHDKVLNLWVQRRLSFNTLSADEVLKVAGEVFEPEVLDQMLLDYAQTQNPTLDERMRLAAKAIYVETADAILSEE